MLPLPKLRWQALSQCLDAAGMDARTLMIAYYGAAGAERIAVRQRLAAERRISLNALRNRALRLRGALENCIRARLTGRRRRDGNACPVTQLRSRAFGTTEMARKR